MITDIINKINVIFGENNKEKTNIFLNIIGIYSILKSKNFLKNDYNENFKRLYKVGNKFLQDITTNKEFNDTYKKISTNKSKFPINNYNNFEKKEKINKAKYNSVYKTNTYNNSKNTSINKNKIERKLSIKSNYSENEYFVKNLKHVKSKIKDHIIRDKLNSKRSINNNYEIITDNKENNNYDAKSEISNNSYIKYIEYDDKIQTFITENNNYNNINQAYQFYINKHSLNDNNYDKFMFSIKYYNRKILPFKGKLEDNDSNVTEMLSNLEIKNFKNIKTFFKNIQNSTLNSTFINQSLNKLTMFDIVYNKKNNINILNKFIND